MTPYPGLPRRALLAGAAGALVSSSTAWPAPGATPVRTAASFADSVGVCAHLASGLFEGRYDRFRALLDASGIRHIREEMRPTNDLARWRDLHATVGVRFHLLASPSTNTPEQMLAYLDTLGPGTVSAVEGQNEADSDWFKRLPVTRGDWAGTTIAYQREIHAVLRRRYDAARMPLLSPSLLDFKPHDVALIRDAAPYCDIVALHPYVQHAQEPETGEFAAGLPWYVKHYRDAFKPGAPMMVTEIGYTNMPSPDGGGISELASSIYVPRLFLNSFQAGMLRTFLYDFIDDGTDPANPEHHYGLVRFDGTPKPAYRTLATLLGALDDGSASPTRDPPDRAPPRVSFPNAPADLRHQGFIRRDGTMVVAAWRPARVWDVRAGRDIDVATTPVSLSADRAGMTWRSMVLDGTSSWSDAQPVTTSSQLAVGARVTLVQLAEART